MKTEADRVRGVLSRSNEWRKSRLVLAVLIICGFRGIAGGGKGAGYEFDSDTGAWEGIKPAASVGA